MEAHHFRRHRKPYRQACLNSLVKDVAAAVNSLQTRFPKVVVVVDSDHGATLLPRGVHELRLPEKAVKERDKHRRFAFVPNDVSLDSIEWYILEPAEFGLLQRCAVARGHSCIGKRPPFLTHGGLTPEETIIPHIECKMAEMPDLVPVEVRYVGAPIRPRRQEVINLKVRNLNQTRLSEFRLTVQGRESKSINIDSEEEAEVHDVAIQMPDAIRESEVIISGFVTYIAYGRQTSEAVEITIPVRHIAIEAEIDKMFEE